MALVHKRPVGRDATYMRPHYGLLDDAGADLLLTGHSHNYERFHRMDADGRTLQRLGLRDLLTSVLARWRQH